MRLDTTYLLASLPGLVWGEAPVYTSAALLNRWKDMLAAAEVEVLRMVINRTYPDAGTFFKVWKMAETELLSMLAAERKRRFKERFFGAAPERPEKLSPSVKAFFELDNPLDRERFLDKLRWDRAVALASHDPMGFDGLLSYLIRTGILEKFTALSAEAGRARLEQAAKASAATTTFEQLK